MQRFRHTSSRTRAVMPRPKVQPQDRQRSARACDACKASKKRCDGKQPCRLCLKKGAMVMVPCTYTPTARDRRRQQHTAAQVGSPIPSPARQARRLREDADESEPDGPGSGSGSFLDGATPKPAMLHSSGGDKGMFGCATGYCTYLSDQSTVLIDHHTTCWCSFCRQHGIPFVSSLPAKDTEALCRAFWLHRPPTQPQLVRGC